MNKNIEWKIEAVAKELLKNTTNQYLREVVEFAYLNPWQDEDDIVIVIQKIVEDGYDITGFGLVEIPAVNIYCFYNETTNQAFDIGYFETLEEPHWSFFYVGEWVGDHNGFPVKTIQEAIDNYVVL